MLGKHVTGFLAAPVVAALLTDQDDGLWPMVQLPINGQL